MNFLQLLFYRIRAFLHFSKCRIIILLYSLNKNNCHELNKMQSDFNKRIEDNFGHQETNYSYKYKLEKQRKSCDDLKRKIHKLETEIL